MSYNCDQREEQEDGAPDEQFETNKKQNEVVGGQPPATGGDNIGDENRHMVIDSAVTKVPHPDVNSTKEIVTLPAHSTDYKLPLYLLIKDKQVKVEIEREKVAKLQGEVERLSAFYSRHPGVDHSKPACTNCHCREGHNRLNCPSKGHAHHSSQFCGDFNKHKDQSGALSSATKRLQCPKKLFQKLETKLSMKLALKHQTVNSFTNVLRTRLISECRARYLTPQAFENWRH